MAEKKPEKKGDKKGDKKPAPSEEGSPYALFIAVLIALFFLFTIIPLLARNLGIADPEGKGVFDPNFISSLKYLGFSIISFLQALSAFVSLLFLIGIIYAKFRTGQLKREIKLQKKIKESDRKKIAVAEENENKRWTKILEHAASVNPSDWRLSILEADILLADLLDMEGYKGETIGDKLKTADRAIFRTLNQAWEAHKIRNMIAHEGSAFNLTQRETKRVIGLFEEVFRDFQYI